MYKRRKPLVRRIAKVMLCVMLFELAAPLTRMHALTTGPSQPEVQSFEPVGTTDMVDLFTGDFVYNIPLMDVEGYPINISYHNGVQMDQEASWVGLGWNINVGNINRGMRGIPDDFNGEELIKEYKVKDEKNYRLTTGAGMEFSGLEFIKLGQNLASFISYNNYRGYGVGFSTSFADVGLPVLTYANMGVGLSASVSSMDGADMDMSVRAGIGFKTSPGGEPVNMGQIGVYGGTGFNSRSGLKDISYGMSATASMTRVTEGKKGSERLLGFGLGSSIPIGLQNYVVAATNSSRLTALTLSGRVGSEVWSLFPHFFASLSYSNLVHENDGTRPAVGYFYMQQGSEKSIQDFSRDRDGAYNKTMSNLPAASMTYDVYSVSGQGTGGMFRPFRNDLGTVFDPRVSNGAQTSTQMSIELGPGNLFEAGTDINIHTTSSISGSWVRRPFKGRTISSFFENFFLKQGGELTYNTYNDNGIMAAKNALYVDSAFKVYTKTGGGAGTIADNGADSRTSRANNISFITNAEAKDAKISFNNFRVSHPLRSFLGITPSKLQRSSDKTDKAKDHHIGEITQVLPDGRVYVYGLPVINNLQKESTFSVEGGAPGGAPYQRGMIKFTDNADNSMTNNKGRDNFYQSTVTPAYAYSYLLTSVHSPSYSDITGDGPTEDDLGSYHKFNYSMVDSDYRWVTPYAVNSDSAQFIPNLYADIKDDKAGHIIGSKELWYLHSVESKHYVAEFYTSTRSDAKGVKTGIKTPAGSYSKNYAAVKATESVSYKLDSIKLYNKSERLLKGVAAVPVKMVVLEYDSTSLCRNLPNAPAGRGKLALKRIYFKYGNSEKSLINPYIFDYSSVNPDYDFAAKDRWSSYKPNNSQLPNFEFPYSEQDPALADSYASAWQLTRVTLPSGGIYNVTYESDDYAYVQDKKAMTMIRATGMGSTVSYTPVNRTYNDLDNVNDYIYFKRELSREFPGMTVKQNYLPDEDLLYFSFFLDVANKNRYEPVKGYAQVESMGICTGDTGYAYIKLKRESVGGKSRKMISPVTLAGLNYGRYHMSDIIHEGASLDGESGAEQIWKGLGEAFEELFTMTKNANERYIGRSLAKTFHAGKCWMRLTSPGLTKKGGGSRVRRITLSDSWNQMAAGGENADVGLEYDYTMTDPGSGQPVSSGVASYEPMIGGDENPLKRPVYYTAEQGRLLPSIELYQEEPLGESFYPSPVVGYSKVTVSSIHQSAGKSSKGVDEYEFYTAKDFPVIVDKTPIKELKKYKKPGLFQKEEELSITQGFSIILNDMHGKAKAISNKVLKGPELETVTTRKFHYFTDDKGRLNNTVKALKRGGTYTKPTFTIQDLVLGQESDMTIDSRYRSMVSESVRVQANLNVILIGFLVIPIPTVFLPKSTHSNQFKTLTATKVIQQYGILKATEVIDHGAVTKVEHTLFDSETGQVLMTKTNNEFNDPVTNIEYPAYWANNRMGGAYENIHFETMIDSMYVNCKGDVLLYDNVDKTRFNEGDELLVRFPGNESTPGQVHRLWVLGMKPATGPIGASESCDDEVLAPISTGTCFFTLQPRNKFIGGDTASVWTSPNQWYKNVYVKVLRSGKRNMLTAAVASVSKLGTAAVSGFSDLFTAFNTNILAAAATTYKDDAVLPVPNHAILWGETYAFNDFVLGKKGAFYPSSQYAYLADRSYTDNHSRRDGVFAEFQNAWQPGSDTTPYCPGLDYSNIKTMVTAPSSKWKRLSTVISFGSGGLVLTEEDASGIRSTALYGHDNTLPIAVASNAGFKEVKYYSFEDALPVFNLNTYNLKLNTTQHWYNFASATSISTNMLGRNFMKLGISAMDANLEVRSEGHTGRYSLLFKNTSAYLFLGDFFNGDYFVSAWIKPTGTTVPANNVFILRVSSNGPTGLITVSTNTVFKVVTRSIDGWYKIEGRMPMTMGQILHFKMPANYLVDDLRIAPDKANMKSFAYDDLTHRLMAELDENNFATFFEYDSEGNLVRTKKETEKGILTVNESRKSFNK